MFNKLLRSLLAVDAFLFKLRLSVWLHLDRSWIGNKTKEQEIVDIVIDTHPLFIGAIIVLGLSLAFLFLKFF